MWVISTPMLGSANVYNGIQFSRGRHACGGFSFPYDQFPLGGFSRVRGNDMLKVIPSLGRNHAFGIPFPTVSPHMGGTLWSH
jgi:hypothetical protein